MSELKLTTEKELTLFVSMLWKVGEQVNTLTQFGQRLVTENRALKQKLEKQYLKEKE